MRGYFIAAVLALAALGLMRLTGLRGPMLTLAGAAIALGGAGYALQGRPGLPGSPRASAERPPPIPMTGARNALLGQFTAADRWLIIADSFERRGNTGEAVGVLRAAVREHPRDYALWVGLGNALADHARGITPAASFAFDRAEQLAPGYPAPRFFHGLALARSGQVEAGLAEWRAILAEAPADASWRPLVEDAILTVQAGEPVQTGS
jgi:cytochrome c-type biogenesis protein CcmH/NrfG